MFIDYHVDTERNAILAWRNDGRAFVSLSDQIRHFSTQPDEGASLTPELVLDALNEAWGSNPNLFRLVTPKQAAPLAQESGMAHELTDGDRKRLHAIIDKHHRRYFADWPTPAQKDNLIDALGPAVAAKIVAGALGRNQIN